MVKLLTVPVRECYVILSLSPLKMYFHDSEIGTHEGITKTCVKIMSVFYWSNVKEYVSKRIKQMLDLRKITLPPFLIIYILYFASLLFTTLGTVVLLLGILSRKAG